MFAIRRTGTLPDESPPFSVFHCCGDGPGWCFSEHFGPRRAVSLQWLTCRVLKRPPGRAAVCAYFDVLEDACMFDAGVTLLHGHTLSRGMGCVGGDNVHHQSEDETTVLAHLILDSRH